MRLSIAVGLLVEHDMVTRVLGLQASVCWVNTSSRFSLCLLVGRHNARAESAVNCSVCEDDFREDNCVCSPDAKSFGHGMKSEKV